MVVAVRLHGENRQFRFVQVIKFKQTRQSEQKVHSPRVLDGTASGSQRCGVDIVQRLAVKSLCKVEESRAYDDSENGANFYFLTFLQQENGNKSSLCHHLFFCR